MLNPQGVLLDQQPQITFYPSTPPSSQQLSPASSTFLHLISGIIKKGQDSKLGDASHKELSNITLRATIDQVNSLKITPAHSLNLQPQANPQEITISLNQIEQSLSNESLKDADRTTTLSTLKTALELYNQYFQEVFVGDENEELRNHLRKRLLSTEDREDENNLYDNIADSTDLSKIKQSATEIAQYFSIIALRKKKIRSVEEEEGVLAVERVGGVRVEEGIDGDQEIKNALITFPSNQNEDYLCLDGTRQRLQMGMFSLLKQDVIAQLLEQEVEDFVLKHVKEIDEGNQIHMKVTIYSAISTLDSANISKIDSFYLNPQKFLQQKDVLEFFDNLDDKIKKGLKARINEIEKQFDEVFKQEQGFLPNAGHIKDFKIFLKTNGFQDVEITDEEFCSPYFDQEGNLRDFTDQAPKETLKKILRERLLESITKKYPTLDIEKFESIFKKDITQAVYEDRIQDQYLPTNIDLFYDDASKSTKLDLSKINNLVAFFEDNSMRASSSQTQEPNIDNITKGLIILRNIGQNFKNSNPFYFLEFFEQFKQSTGLNFEDYFFEAQPQQDQSHPQSRQVKGIFKDYEGIIKYIINRRNILSKSLLQKPVSQIYIASEEQKELFEVCNSIFLGKEDEDSMRKIQDFKEKLNRDQFLAREVYNFFTQKERIFFVKLVESDDNEVLRKLIDLLPMVQKNQLKEYKPDAIKNLLHLAAQNGSSKVIDTLTNPDIVGININLNDDLGSTPLMIASQNGHLQVVKELIKKG
ncbi:MAG: ankyrin repeat domain-containing protein, partial [Rickettsiales bacterium]